jgi:hypothetical protein
LDNGIFQKSGKIKKRVKADKIKKLREISNVKCIEEKENRLSPKFQKLALETLVVL